MRERDQDLRDLFRERIPYHGHRVAMSQGYVQKKGGRGSTYRDRLHGGCHVIRLRLQSITCLRCERSRKVSLSSKRGVLGEEEEEEGGIAGSCCHVSNVVCVCVCKCTCTCMHTHTEREKRER